MAGWASVDGVPAAATVPAVEEAELLAGVAVPVVRDDHVNPENPFSTWYMGRGTVFGFDVPLADKPEPVAAPVAPPKDSSADLSGRLIVVIDDEEAIVEGMPDPYFQLWGLHELAARERSRHGQFAFCAAKYAESSSYCSSVYPLAI